MDENKWVSLVAVKVIVVHYAHNHFSDLTIYIPSITWALYCM